MTARLSMKLLAGIAVLAMTGIVSHATADGGCDSPYVWGRNSYFGDRWEYSYRHAYPEHNYRSSRHFIYYRRVPHFYNTSNHQTSNYYCSPEFQAYYTYGPYSEPARYHDPQRYNSPATRPYMPYCEDDDSSREHDLINQRTPADDARDRADLQLSLAGEKLLNRGWELLRNGSSNEATALFAEAAMLRNADALPRLAYGLAAGIDGQDTVAAWAIRKAVTIDHTILTRVPDDAALRQQIVDAMQNRRQADVAESTTSAEQRDSLVVMSILAVLGEDAEVMKSALTELAKLDDDRTTRAVAVASRNFVAKRWSNSAESTGKVLVKSEQ